jgi:hypothetical protein
MAKTKVISTKHLSSVHGAYDVSFGVADVNRRQRRDFSKDGIKEDNHDRYDDHKERMKRYNKGGFFGL